MHNERFFTSTAGGLCSPVYMRGRVKTVKVKNGYREKHCENGPRIVKESVAGTGKEIIIYNIIIIIRNGTDRGDELSNAGENPIRSAF